MSLKKSVVSVAVLATLGCVSNFTLAANLAAEGQVWTDTDFFTNGGDRALGLWYINTNEAAKAEELIDDQSANISISTRQWDSIVGGSYLKTVGKNKKTFTMQTSTVVMDGQETSVLESVVGGMMAADANGISLSGVSTHLIIKNGTFGTVDESDVLVKMIVAGNLVKAWGKTEAEKMTSTLKTANLDISGGAFNSVILGGSVAYGYYGTAGNLDSKVEKVNVSITGGTFNAPIVAGGAAGGHNAHSTVNEAYLSINGSNGLQINDNIYTGSLLISNGSNNQTAVVNKATLKIKNATVKDIYDGDVKATWEGTDGNNGKWVYVPVLSTTTPTQTQTTLTNVEAGTVNLQNSNSTLTLRVEDNGETAIETLKFNGTIVAEADGATNDTVNGDVNTFLTKKLRIANMGQENDMTLTLEEGEGIGEVTANVDVDENGDVVVTNKVEKANTKNDEIANELSVIPSMITRAELNDVRKRMGDLRSSSTAHGAWARYEGGKMSGLGLENEFNKVQVGVDTLLPTDVRVGVAFSYTDGEVEGQKTAAETDTYSLAAYGTWFGEKGQFVDVIGRMATIKTDLSAGFGLNTDIDQVALSLSGQFGWRFDITDALYVEPSVEATYTFLNSESFANASSGYQYELDDTHSLIAKLGASAGFQCPSDKGDVYVRAGVVREFFGDTDLTVSKVGVDPRTTKGGSSDTWFEYGIGANINFAKNAYFWVDAERTAGADIDEDWRATAGVRFNF